MEKGTLKSIGRKKLGKQEYEFFRCVDCGTDYPDSICNGIEISLCPWCREDSKPYQNGRGI